MNNLARISKCFWGFFEPQLERGIPVFFTFTENLIVELIRNEFGIYSSLEATTFFLDNANSLLTVQNKKLIIDRGVFDEQENGKSLVIILIALQVLAAEKMTKNEAEFSENAYYPPLRKLISNELGLDRVNPFSLSDFSFLWQVFKTEILAFSGQFYITFDIEKKGASKFKIFPLSQALLSHKDLIILAVDYYNNKLKYTYQNQFDWRMFFIGNSKKISNRGTRCILNSSLKEPLEDQFKFFLEAFSLEQVTVMQAEVVKLQNSFNIRLHPEESIFDGRFSYRVEFVNDGLFLDEYLGLERIVTFLEINSYLTVFRDSGTYFGDPKNFHNIHINEIGFLSFNDSFIQLIEATLKIDNLIFDSIELDNCGIVKFYFLNDPRIQDLNVQIIRGRLSSSIIQPRLVFTGGIMFDRRGYNYFSEFAPTDILYDNKVLDDSDTLVCNGVSVKYKDLKKLFTLNSDMYYELVFKNESKNLFLKSVQSSVRQPVGLFVNSHVLFLKKKVVNPQESFIYGFTAQNIFNLVSFTNFDFTQFFVHEKNDFVNLDSVQVDRLIRSIDNSYNLGTSHKTYIKLFLKQNKTAPKYLVDKLMAA